MGALFLLSRKPVCRLRKVLFWWTERLVTSIFLLPFQKLFLNSSKKWTIIGMLHTLYFANENVWNHNYYLIRNSQIWAFLREYELGSLKIKGSNSPAFLGWDLDLPQSIPKQLSRNRHHLIQPRTDKFMEKKKIRKRLQGNTREQREGVSHYFTYSLLSVLDSPLKECRAGRALALRAEAQRAGAEREDRLLGLPGTSMLPFPAPPSFIGAWNITSSSKCCSHQ